MKLDIGTFNNPPAQTRIVVAMSGGVDSSVTAALLKEMGYDVVGITLQLYDHGKAIDKKGACCAGKDIYDAQQVAAHLDIPHYVLDYEQQFRKAVVDDFADSYVAGYTPLPCVRCNQRVKFRDLLETAKDLGGDALATGHYVQRRIGPQGPELHKGIDPTKDQSFFLFTTTPQQLDFLRFPLGGLPKNETRKYAARFGLQVAEKPDSQDICFVPTGKYVDVVSRLRPGALEPGDIVHIDGHILGRHDGTLNYTVGQRRGLGVSANYPLYVVDIDAQKNQVIVGPKEALAKQHIALQDLNWVGPSRAADSTFKAYVKIRSTQGAMAATVTVGPAGTATVALDTPEYGVAPGQACVFYDDTHMLGGGWIAKG